MIRYLLLFFVNILLLSNFFLLNAQDHNAVKIIFKNPELKWPDRGLISSNQEYAVVAKHTMNTILFAVYDLKRMKLTASNEILMSDDLNFSKIENISDDGRYLALSSVSDEFIPAYYDVQDEKLYNEEPDDSIFEYSRGFYNPSEVGVDGGQYEVLLLEEDDREVLEIYDSKKGINIYTGDNIFGLYDSKNQILKFSSDHRYIAVYENRIITVWDLQTNAKVWQSIKQSRKSPDFALLNNGIIVCSRINQKQISYFNYFWYNFITDDIYFTTDYLTILPISCLDQNGSYINIISDLYNTKDERITLTQIDLSTLKSIKLYVENGSCNNIFEQIEDSLIEIDSVYYTDFNKRRQFSWDYAKMYSTYYDESGNIKEPTEKCQLDLSFFIEKGIRNDNFKDSSAFIKSYIIYNALDNKATFSEARAKSLLLLDYSKIIQFWNGNKTMPIEKEVNMFLTKDTIPVFLTNDNYYFSEDLRSKSLSFNLNGEIFSFDQFDLKYNRPDIILDRLGYAEKSLIDAYYRAYLKRLKKMGFKEEDLGKDFHLPESEINNFEYLPVIDQKEIDLNLKFNDSKYELDRYNIWINDVPVYGVRGKSLKNINANEYSIKEHLILNNGNNKIQVSCINKKGVESYKETVEITYKPKEDSKPDLYVISIGVSEYHNSTYNLTFADKDAENVADLFAQNKKNFENIHVTKLLNNDATKENILKLKEQLQNTNVDDQVIVFFAGHGLLDGYDYYLGTTETDAENLFETALPYEDLEALLDGIPARQKLLLLDACHSGEVDDDKFVPQEDQLFADNKRSVTYIGKTRNALKNKSKLSYNNSFELMKELFADLRRGTGSMVISSAGGGEFAIEGEMMKDGKIVKVPNGIFTYSLIEALRNKKADADNDGIITISELKTYVFDNVSRLSAGYQNPTSRMENLELDFVVW